MRADKSSKHVTEIVRMHAENWPVKRIALAFQLSPSTVRSVLIREHRLRPSRHESVKVELLRCIGGPIDGHSMSSLGAPDEEPWLTEGRYVREPMRESDDPLLRLVPEELRGAAADVWRWSHA